MANSRFSAKRIEECETDEEAEVRTFLASIDLLGGTLFDQTVYRGRAILEWYADWLVVGQFDFSSASAAISSSDQT